MQPRPGALRLWNIDPGHLLVADWGGGTGNATLPGALVSGGAFVEGVGFGPYGLSFTLEVTFANWSQFENSLIYGGNSPDYPYPGWKTAGIVLDVINQTAASPYTVVAGVRISSSGTRLFDIYVHNPTQNTFTSLVNGGGTTFISPSSQPLTLRATVAGTRITLGQSVNGGAFTSIQTNKVDPAVTANIVSVKAAAARVAGVITHHAGSPDRTIDISKIVLSAPNIVPFNGPPTSSPPSPPLAQQFLRRTGTELILDGQYQASGTNRVDLLNFFCGLEATPEYGCYVLDQLAASTDQRVVRFAVSDEFGKYVKDLSATIPGWPRVNLPLWEMFEHAQTSYFAAFDRLLNEASLRGIKLVPVLVWDGRNPLAHSKGVPVSEVGSSQVKELFDVIAGNDQEVNTARTKMQNFIGAVVARYRNNPTILFWETGNEWDNSIHKSLLTVTGNGWVDLWDNPAQCGTASAAVANLVRGASFGNDTNHLIGTGYAGASTLYNGGSSGPCPATNLTLADAMAALHPPIFDLVSFHLYADSSTRPCSGGWFPAPFDSAANYLTQIFNAARALHAGTGDVGRPLYIGETNWHTTIFNATEWQAVLDAYLGLPDKAPRSQLTMTWEWMRVPHDTFPGSEWALHNQTPAQAAPTTALSLFESTLAPFAATPRVLHFGYGQTYATQAAPGVSVVARIADVQGDVTSVRLERPTGLLITNLATADGQTWTGSFTPSGQFDPGTDRFYVLKAEDSKQHVGKAPHLQIGSGSAAPVPAMPPIANGGVPGDGFFPVIRSGGFEGFGRIGVDSGRLRVTVDVRNEFGAPLAAPTTVLGQFQPATYPLFALRDDGLSGDTTANDGIWTYEVVLAPSTSLISETLLVEVVAACAPPTGGVRASDIWPRVKMH